MTPSQRIAKRKAVNPSANNGLMRLLSQNHDIPQGQAVNRTVRSIGQVVNQANIQANIQGRVELVG